MNGLVVWFTVMLFGFVGCRYQSSNSQHVQMAVAKNQVTTIPVMIHLDRSISRKLFKEYSITSKEKAWFMFKRILTTVERLFLLPHLNEVLDFQLLDVKIVKNNTRYLKFNENVSTYLKNYCLWQSEKKKVKKKRYYSVLFTGLDLYYVENNTKAQIRTSTGRGYLGGICSIKNSCTVLEWHKDNVAYILAHEIAHSLGVPHDEEANKHCSGKHIMSAKYNPRNPAMSWTTCNKRNLLTFMQSKRAWCIREKQ